MENFKLARLFDAGGDLQKQWYVHYSYRHPETGKFVRFRRVLSVRLRTRHLRHLRAQEIIREINQKLRSGWNPIDAESMAGTGIITALVRILEVKKTILRPRSISTYRHIFRGLETWLKNNKLENLPAGMFSYRNAMQFLDWLKTDRKVMNRTYNNYLSALRTLWNFLIEREYVEFNPFKRCKKLQKDDTEIVTFTKSELEIIRTRLPQDNPQLWACVQLIFYCFMRPAEIMRLQAKDIDLDRGLIYVHGYLSKNKKDQIVVMPEKLIQDLRKLNLEQIPEGQFVFASKLHPGYRQAAPTRMAEIWRKWADSYGIKKKLYHMKHTGAGMAVDAGINIRDLQLQLRHHSLDMTQIYLDRFRKDPGDAIRYNFPAI